MSVVVIGSGLAGYLLVKGLRDQNYEGEIIVITNNDGHFYSKPMLSNALTQNKEAQQLITLTSNEMVDKYHFKLIANAEVMDINRATQQIELSTGEQIGYQSCVLACGASPIELPLTGDGVSDIVHINHLHEYESFRHKLSGAKSVTIIGAGLVGTEFAADLIGADYKVHLVHDQGFPVNQLLPQTIGEALLGELRASGVEWHGFTLTREVSRLEKGYQVLMHDGQKLESDIVISAVGLRPNIDLAKKVGLAVNRGIVVDRHCQTSDPNLFALGDCAEVSGHSMYFVAPIRQCVGPLIDALVGEHGLEVVYPVMPVILKTPMCRVIVSPPLKGSVGQWQTAGTGADLEAIFVNEKGLELGFAVSGAMVKNRAALMKRMPDILAATDRVDE